MCTEIEMPYMQEYLGSRSLAESTDSIVIGQRNVVTSNMRTMNMSAEDEIPGN
jgi:hypothetical protein